MLDPHQLLVFALAVCLTGLSKGGFAGLGMIATPLLATVMDPVLAISIMLPILLVQDALSFVLFRQTVDWTVFWNLVPGAAIGISLGYLLAASVNSAIVSGVIGAIAVLFALYFLANGQSAGAKAVKRGGWWGILCGAGSGFSSVIAHAGTPPFQVYTLPLRLSRDVFVGTSVYFFATVNVIKVVPYLMLGQLSVSTSG